MQTRSLAAPAPRHPFRQSIATTHAVQPYRNEENDLKLFALSFTAFFICFYTFIF
ncbi:hypothetical protein BH10PSE15_BH10PSE15_04480 [soil metagenome]